MAAGPWTAEEQDTLRRLVAEGVAQSEIGRQLGRSRGAVANQAAKLGVHGDRTKTAAATEAKMLDAAARRAALEVELLEDAEEMRRRMFAPTVVYNFGGKDNTYNEATVDEPPHADKLKLMQAATAAIDRSLKISVHDGAKDEHTEAKAFITQLGEALLATAPEAP